MIYKLEELRDKKLDWLHFCILTNGCFDLLHIGHVRFLKSIYDFAPLMPLIVGINSDISVRNIKGPKRPIIPVRERAEILSGLIYVNHVVIFDEPTADALISVIQPLAYYKGGDIKGKPLPEQETLDALKIPVYYQDVNEDVHVTDIVTRILEIERRK